MSSVSAFSTPTLVRIVTLLGELRSGAIRVPRFQRPPLWVPDQRLLLLESLYEGYPIGALLTWDTTRVLAEFPGVGPLRPIDVVPTSVRRYVLDGHQRLATLFGVLGPGLYAEEERMPAWDPAFEHDEWRVWFDVDAPPEGPRFVQKRARQRQIPASWVPLDVILDPYAVSEETDRLRRAGRDRPTVNRITWLADRLREYTVPVIELQTDDLEVVTNSFKRLNSAGTTMSELHMVKALCWSEEFDLEDQIERLASTLTRPRWHGFARDRLLDVAKALLDLPVSGGSVDVVARRILESPGILERSRDALERMTSLLDWLGGPVALPYAYQAMLVAVAAPDEDSVTSERIWSWFIATTFTEAFSGASASRFKRARQHLADYLGGRTNQVLPEPDLLVSPLGRFDFNTAAGKGQAFLLAHGWYEALVGQPMDQRMAGFEHVAQFGAPALIGPPVRDPSANQTTVAARFLSVDGPPFMRDGRGWRMKRPRAHLVDPDAEKALVHGDIPQFLSLRLKRIQEHLDRFARGLPRPRVE